MTWVKNATTKLTIMGIKIGIGRIRIGTGGSQNWESYFLTRTPTGLVLTVLSDTSIKVDWTDAAAAADGLKVYFNDVLKDTVAFGVGTTTITGLTAGTTYNVEVVAYKGINESDAISGYVTISTLLSNLVFSLKWDGSQFINAVTGLAMVDHGSVAAGTPIVSNSEVPGTFVTAESKYLSTPDTAALSMGDTDFMIAMWVNITDTDIQQIFASKSLSAGNQREWAVWSEWSTAPIAKKFAFTVSGDGVTWSGTESEVTVNGADYFILAWHDSSANTINIQLNRGTVYSTAHTTGAFGTISDLVIGGVANPALYAGGLIGNVDIWKGRLLSESERSLLYDAGSGNKHPFDSYPSKVLLMGDKSGSDDVAISQAVNTVLMAQNPHMIIGTGDYDGLATTTDQLLTNLPKGMFACPGNHDDWVVGTRTGFNAWFSGGGYQKVSIPFVDFFLYDYYLKMDESGYYTLSEAEAITLAARQASTQGQWLINGLAASTAKWKVVVMHNPPWASPSDFPTPNIINQAENMRWDWYALGVDLLICSHFHFYERLLKNTGSGNVPIILLGTTGTTDTLGWTSLDADSIVAYSPLTDTDFEGGMLEIMTVTESTLTIDVSAIKSDYSVVTGKDQLILT